MKPTVIFSRDEFVKVLDQYHRRRAYVAQDLLEYVNSLPEESAFALSRMLPTEILSKLASHRLGGLFADKILDYHLSISKEGPLVEMTKVAQAEQLFLATRASELLNVIGAGG